MSARTPGFVERVEAFFLSPATGRPMAVLRVTLAPILLFQALSIVSVVPELFGRAGILQGALADYFLGFDTLETIGLRGLIRALGLTDETWLRLLFSTYLCSLGALATGWKLGLAAPVACATHALLGLSGRLSMYGVDQFAQLALFYLAVHPGGEASVWPGGPAGPATPRARLALRLLQVNMCIAYLSSGVAKMYGTEWWNGEAMFRSVMMPLYATIPMGWMASVPLVAKLSCWATLILEAGYPVFIWPAATRRLWIAGIVALHLGILVFLGLGTFALTMIVLTSAAFGVPAEPLTAPAGAPEPERPGS